MKEAKLKGSDIDAIITVSSTGLAIPSLDSLLINQLNLSLDAQRTPIFGLGCAGGTTGLARAAQIARTMPGANVMLLVVELAGINVHINDMNPSLFISAALFGDGTAYPAFASYEQHRKPIKIGAPFKKSIFFYHL